VRYNPNGTFDTTFDVDGKVSTAVGVGDDCATAMAVQSDGKILVAGRSRSGAEDQFALVRYNSDGSLDASFDSDGKMTVAVVTPPRWCGL